MRWWRKKKVQEVPAGKVAWAFVPEGDIGQLASAVTRTIENARLMGIDPAHVEIRSARPQVGSAGGPSGWHFEFAIPEEPWRQRGIPIIRK